MVQLLSRDKHDYLRRCAVAAQPDMPSPSSISTPIQALTSQILVRIRSRRNVLRELADHIEDHSTSLREKGLDPTIANEQAVRAFGDPHAVAAQVERIRNQGSWLDASIAATPSLIVMLLFASHRWYELEWIIGTAVVALAVATLGVYRFGKQAWVFCWLGYAIFPVLFISIVSLGTTAHAAWSVMEGDYMARDPLSWVLGIGLGGAGIGTVTALLVWLSRKDWIHGILVVLPITLLSIALLAFDRGFYATIEQADAQNAALFGAFAVVVAAAIRMSDRLLKIGLLAASLPLGFLIASSGINTSLRIAIIALLTIPALLLISAPLVVTSRQPESDEGIGLDAWTR